MPKPNDRIGPYQLIRRLGKGSFAEAWLARNATVRNAREVVLKIPLADELDVDALLQEATLWARATGHHGHANVLEFIEARVFEQQAVIISEYAPGGSMEQWLKEHGGGAPSIDEALEMARGILSGLAYLHSGKIIHRDLKPANILLQDATPRIADFGLSRVVKTSIHSKVVAGTWAYMAPEAFKAVRNEQTDLWSVAVILYQMLAGRLPFWADDRPSLMDVIRTREPKPLPATVPDWLCDVLAKALQKNAAERYPSATELREALTPEPRITVPQPQPLPPPAPRPRPLPPPIRVAPPIEPAPVPAVDPYRTHLTTKLKTVPRRLRVWLPVGLAGLLAVAGVSYWAVQKPGEESVPGSGLIASQPLPALGREFSETVNGVKLAMIRVPAGSFQMGSPDGQGSNDEHPQHPVKLADFYMGKTEVTQALWQAVRGNNPARFTGDLNRPVEQVSWEDAQAFCQKLSGLTGKTYRLPSEAEWEYACRAGTTGDYAGELEAMAWYSNNAGSITHLVGQKQANKFGLYDMHGNVWEWCEDVWHDSYNGAPATGATWLSGGDSSRRVLRGGAFYVNDSSCRSAYRGGYVPGGQYFNYGFRVVVAPRTL